jgi:hypothetical protein
MTLVGFCWFVLSFLVNTQRCLDPMETTKQTNQGFPNKQT